MKTILITGATGSIGQALAECYANKHTQLILTGRNEEKLNAARLNCEKKGANVVIKTLDICDQSAFIEWVSDIDKTYPIDIVIANAGINSTIASKESENNFEVTKKIFDTNVYGVLATITPLIERMKQQKCGQIAIISSLAAYRGLPQSAAYCASKAAIKVYGESLRAYLAVYNIKVNVICPGFVKSAMSDSLQGPKPFMISAAKAAKIIKKGLAKNKGRIAFPSVLSIPTWLATLLPNRFIDFLLRKTARNNSKA